MKKMMTGLVVLGLFFAMGVARAGELPFAVVELYTSQGCSSCPPADAYLRKLIKESREDHEQVYPLSFHVDYWNQLGWEDPYSSPQFSKRQRVYSNVWQANRVYTPQFIVNGRKDMATSRPKEIAKHVKGIIKSDDRIPIKISLQMIGYSGGKVRLKYFVAGDYGNAVINFALVERGLSKDVPTGENANRTLSHDNVVRVFKTHVLERPGGLVSIEAPEDLNFKNSSVVVYVQQREELEIIGAVEIAIKI